MPVVAGDIAIVAYNSDVNKGFSFVALSAIGAAEVIKFTDNGWTSGGAFRANEGVVTWTAPTGGVTAGTVVTVSNISTTSISATVGTVTRSGSPDFSTSGDQVLAYTGTESAPTFVFALNNEGAGVWQTTAADSNTSALPTGLTNGQNAVALNEIDNARYNGATTGTKDALLALIVDRANWTGDDTNNVTAPASFTVSSGITGTVSIGNATVAEGGVLSFDVTRTNAATAFSLTVATGTGGTATAGSDYTETTVTLSFAAGDPLTKTFTVQTTDDTLVEGNETVSVTLSAVTNITGTTTIATGTGTGTITDNDAATTVSITGGTVTEGNTGTAILTFTVTRSDNAGAFTVDYASANGTATSDSDYAAATGTLTFAAGGALSQTISITVNGDTTVEPDETLTVTLSNLQSTLSAATLGTATATGTITNDDAAVAPVVWINEFHYDNVSTDSGEFVEVAGTAGTDLTGWSIVLYNGNGGAVYDTIALSGTIDNEQNGFGAVSFARAGIQNGSPDGLALVNASGTLVQFLTYEGTFTAVGGPADGVAGTDIGVAQAGTEPANTSSLGLTGTGTSYGQFAWAATTTSASPGSINAGQAFGTPAPTVGVTGGSIAEGDSGTRTLTFTVTRSDTSTAFTVDYATANGTATAGSDYAAATGTLSFAAGGPASQTVSVTINGDTANEADETFTLALSNIVNGTGTTVLGTATATGTITNDDLALVKIYDIQGAGHKSPYVGGAVGAFGNSDTVRVSVEGVVTAIAANGFYIQDATGDGNVNTSDGIFVFTNTSGTNYTAGQALAVGTSVRIVNARVDEFRPGSDLTITELSITSSITGSSIVDLGGNTAIAPVVLGVDRLLPTGAISSTNFSTYDPASYAIDFWESLEGMLVRVPQSVTISKTNEFRTSASNNTAEGPPNEEIWVAIPGNYDAASQTSRGGLIISATDYNPERVQIDDIIPGLDLPTVDVGATLGAVDGVVNYDFGNYEVLVSQAPTVVAPSTIAKETTTLARDLRAITIGDYNVENLDPVTESTASGAVEGTTLYARLGNSDTDDFATRAQHIVTNMGAPTIVSLQEIQDDDGATISGVLSSDLTLTTLVNAIVAAGGPTYSFAYVAPSASNINGGQPNANIRNAFLYRADQVTLESYSLLDPTNAAFSASRKPLVGNFSYNGVKFTIINVHMNSKGGDDPLFGADQPPVLSSETQRINQATVIKAYVDSLLAADPNARIALMGDVNDFTFSNPFKVLTGQSAGQQVLFDLAEALLPANERYGYNFDGNTQELDHQLATASLLNGASAQYDIVHVNSEFADQVSDHDPSVSRFDFTAFGETLTLTAAGDTVDGGAGNDSISGLGGADSLAGGDGADTLTGGAGDDTLVGGTGSDTARLAGNAAATALTQNFDGSWNAVGPDGTDLLRGIETAAFADTTVTLSAAAPVFAAALATDSGASAADGITNAVTLAGTTIAGGTVTLTQGTTVLGTATADATGAWSFTASGLADGAQSITASATDGIGATRSADVAFTLDTAIPLTAGLANDTGANTTDGITTDATLSGVATEGDSIAVTVDGTTTTVTAGAGGAWSVAPTLADGARSATVVATDLAGNSASRTVTFTLDTAAPVFTSGATAALDENTTGIAYQAAATDAQAVTYSLGGTDAALFDIDATTGAVSFKAAPDFEAPADAGGDNAYDITVGASDGRLSSSVAVTVTVRDVNEAPAVTSPANADFTENGTGVAYQATASDPDAGTTLTYSLGGTDAGVFDIDATTGDVTFRFAPDFDVPSDSNGDNVYAITVTASDGTLDASQAVTITVTNVNEAPMVTSDASADFAENGTGVAYYATASDPDAGETLTFSLGGTDADLFAIDATTGEVTFIVAPDFEAPADAGGNNVYHVVVTVSDGTLSADKAVAITVRNVNEAGAPQVTAIAANASGTGFAISGTAETGVSVAAIGNSAALATTTAAAGRFAVTASLATGTSDDVTLRATDDAGNVADAAPFGIAAGAAGVAITFSAATAVTLTGSAGDDTLTGGTGNDSLVGGTGADSLAGGDGADTLSGGNQIDTLAGGAGDDWYIVDTTANVVVEAADGGTDTVVRRAGTYTLGAFIENFLVIGATGARGTGNELDNLMTGSVAADTLSGAAGNDTLIGNTGNDSLVGGAGNDSLSGGDGADTLYGGSEADTMAGGAGDDWYIADSISNVIVETADGGIDTVVRRAGSYTLGAFIENFLVTGTAGARGTGNALDNLMTGSVAADTLNGAAGNDTLIGNAGNDSLVGGAGNDSLAGGDGADTLYGGSEADTMAGGAGDDWYIVDSISNVIVETADGGIDTVVRRAGSYTLGAFIENFLVTGTTGAGGTGNALDNLMTGSVAADTLNGAAGNDTLVGNAGSDSLVGGAGNDSVAGGDGADTLFGGAGADTLSGGDGADVFRFTALGDSAVATPDVLLDFQLGVDRIDLSALGPMAWRGFGPYDGTAAQLRLTQSGGDTFVRYDSSDVGAADNMVIRLSGTLALTQADFVLA